MTAVAESIGRRMALTTKLAQTAICRELAEVDGAEFREVIWSRPGGTTYVDRIMEGGEVFERVSINHAVVSGAMTPQMAAAATGRTTRADSSDVRFFATGISLVIHPRNPMAPTTHANYRYFELDGGNTPELEPQWWFGGGSDLTPYYLFDEDARHFHQTYRTICNEFDPAYYPAFKKRCDDYFNIPHRGERRGVGGIFFDGLNDRPAEVLLGLVTNCITAVMPAYLPIVQRRKNAPFSVDQQHWQHLRRGRYAEFNLLYDRGTMFGLKMAGPANSILMSLPPTVRWEFESPPPPGSDESRLLEVLRDPKEWA